MAQYNPAPPDSQEVSNDFGNPLPIHVETLPEGHGSLRDVLMLLEMILSRQAFVNPSGRLQTEIAGYPTANNATAGFVGQVAVHTGHVGSFLANLDQMAKVSTAAATALRANITVS